MTTSYAGVGDVVSDGTALGDALVADGVGSEAGADPDELHPVINPNDTSATTASPRLPWFQ
jgi:hypothetical protein